VRVLRLRLGMDAEGYLTRPAPKEIEPDYEGVTESGRGRGRGKRNQGTSELQLDAQSDEEDGETLGNGGPANDDSQALPRPPSSTLPRYHTPRPPLPRSSLPLPSPAAVNPVLPPPANPEVSYGVYFVPKGSEQRVSFVGTTNFPPSFAEPSPPLSTSSQPSILPNYSFSSLFSSSNIAPHASPMSSSSSSSNLPPALPTTPPSARVSTTTQLYDDVAGPRAERDMNGQESEERSKWFCREMSRAFGHSEAATDPSTDAHGPPLPIIRLPRFSAGFPGSTSTSSSSSSTDTYLHISRVFQYFSPLLFPSTSSSTPHLPLPEIVHLLHAQQQASLVSNPVNFDFSRPPTCIFLPPPSATCTTRPSQSLSTRKEMYVLSTAIEGVKRELESRGK